MRRTLAEVYEIMEGVLEQKQPFGAWHPDEEDAGVQGRLADLQVPAMGAEVLKVKTWHKRWKQGQEQRCAELVRWSMRAARAAGRRAVRAALCARSHEFSMGRFGVFGELLRLKGPRSQPQPYTHVREANGVWRRWNTDEEELKGSGQYYESYFESQGGFSHFAKRYSEAGVEMAEFDTDWEGAGGPGRAARIEARRSANAAGAQTEAGLAGRQKRLDEATTDEAKRSIQEEVFEQEDLKEGYKDLEPELLESYQQVGKYFSPQEAEPKVRE